MLCATSFNYLVVAGKITASGLLNIKCCSLNSLPSLMEEYRVNLLFQGLLLVLFYRNAA